jgi:hypothetical protein
VIKPIYNGKRRRKQAYSINDLMAASKEPFTNEGEPYANEGKQNTGIADVQNQLADAWKTIKELQVRIKSLEIAKTNSTDMTYFSHAPPIIPFERACKRLSHGHAARYRGRGACRSKWL